MLLFKHRKFYLSWRPYGKVLDLLLYSHHTVFKCHFLPADIFHLGYVSLRAIRSHNLGLRDEEEVSSLLVCGIWQGKVDDFSHFLSKIKETVGVHTGKRTYPYVLIKIHELLLLSSSLVSLLCSPGSAGTNSAAQTLILQWSSCSSLPNARIRGMCRHAWLQVIWLHF